MDKIVKYIEKVPVYQDNDFKNLYTKFSIWLKEYLGVDRFLLDGESLTEEFDHFEFWCEKNEITPHKE